MSKLKDWTNRYILDSPECKTIVGYVLPILSGVFTGTLILEISTANGINWKLLISAKSLYALLLLTVVIYKYHRSLYRREKEIRQFLDTDFCIAYMRSQCLPEAAEQYKRLIRDGQGGELKQAMDEIKKILK